MAALRLQQLVRQGMQLQQRGDLQRAKKLYRQVLETVPQHPDALHLYGLACHQLGDHQTAIKYIQRAVELVPDQPVLRNNLGNALCKAGRFDEAIEHLRNALELKSGYAGAHQNLSSAHAQRGDHDAALEHARQAVKLDDSSPAAWFDLGLVLLDHVLLDESVAAFRKALALQPAYPRAATSLLYLLSLLPGTNPSEIAKEHLEVAGKAFAKPDATPSPTRSHECIRLGYVSGDFRAHAVNYFFEPVLEHHNREKFEVFCYSDVTRPDHVTTRLVVHAGRWRDVAGWDDRELAKQIRNDGIDILVDLAGHTRDNRLGVFAHKPAPCQISWLGYPNTTGLAAMDYRVVDHHTMPDDEPPSGSEALIRLAETFACFRPPDEMPAVLPPPHLENGYVTLGCLHKLEKLNEDVIALWALILRQNPQARLLLARDQLDKWQSQRLQNQFQALGISNDRLQMKRFKDPEKEFFGCFADIDVLLDTFPWSGHTLACCALYSGVPVVTLRGDSHAGRMVASVLECVGLEELVSEDIHSYAGVVTDLCQNPQRLADYRNGLRDRFEASPLRDEAGFTLSLEDACLRILNH